jgi:pimeloyl-ACP methyl ester carboxylesterase
MAARGIARDHEWPAARLLAGLAGSLEGDPDHRAPLILLHGLTFDRRMWRPALAELRKIDPGRQVLAVDLPGHGRSPAWPSYDLEGIAEGVHRAVGEAKLRPPVIAGHSAAAVVATVYAARYPTCGQARPVARRPAPRTRIPGSLGDVRGQHAHRATAPRRPGAAAIGP